MEPRGLQRFIGRQLGLVLGECRAQGTRSQNSSPVSLGYPNQRPQQVHPHWGRLLDIPHLALRFWSRGTTAIAAVWWPLAMVLTAVAVCNSRRGAAR
jgi:hypothetical protein